MTRLFAFGCSHTYGQALPDVWDYENNKEIMTQGPSKYAWPQILSDKLNLDCITDRFFRYRKCINLGSPGASNKEVWFHIVNTEFKKSDIVVILWPGRSRWCIIKDPVPYSAVVPVDMDYCRGVKDFNNKKVEKIVPFRLKKKHPPSTAFYKYLFDEHDYRIDYLMRVNYVSILLKNKVKILKHYETEIGESCNYPNWFMGKFCKEKFFIDILEKYPNAEDNSHSGIDGHKAFANIVYKEIKNDLC